ncbi:DUF1090 domain-containing protein [Tatumella citrea]|uniref:DUF1090 domain-containing protein n=1 Tax=Tatumella citrea TaxID=53336 RepID=A0A1Y0LB89_TATCI|nr:DUF1090 domain-containing protein [Tatumella citrea]ARU95334.1 hypothetical protein A7K98_17265 [Tatumella citrea]ARU99375.1 hypothetical protein A7K99_17250 [Tatumella citrea]
MKKTLTALSMTLLSLLAINAASAAETCADKRAAIENQMSYARQHNNSFQLSGLQKALDEVNAHCTPESVRHDARKDIKQAEKKLADKKQDLREAEDDLNQAIARGNSSKIKKYQEKVAEKKQDIEKLNRQLNQANHDFKRLN